MLDCPDITASTDLRETDGMTPLGSPQPDRVSAPGAR